jgi:hypothetical protein
MVLCAECAGVYQTPSNVYDGLCNIYWMPISANRLLIYQLISRSMGKVKNSNLVSVCGVEAVLEADRRCAGWHRFGHRIWQTAAPIRPPLAPRLLGFVQFTLFFNANAAGFHRKLRALIDTAFCSL